MTVIGNEVVLTVVSGVAPVVPVRILVPVSYIVYKFCW